MENSRVGIIQAAPVLLPGNLQTSKRSLDSDSNSAPVAADTFSMRESKRHQALNLSPANNDSVDSTYNQFINGGRTDEICKSVLLRSIPNEATATDVAFLFSPFSSQTVNVKFVSKGEALVEVQDSETAERAVQYFNAYCVAIKGVPITAMLASSADSAPLDSNMHSAAAKGSTDAPISRVLLVTVVDIRYPVDLELLHKLFCVYGQIEKLITFTKSTNRYQALIQFSDLRGSREALNNLNNKYIFDGCNRIQIQTSKLAQLNVKENNEKSWDFTVASFPVKPKLSDGVRNTSMGASGYGNFSVQDGSMHSATAEPFRFMPGSTPSGFSSGAPHNMNPYGSSISPTDHHYGAPHQQQQYGASSPGRPSTFEQPFINPEWLQKLPKDIQQNPSILQRMNPMQSCVVICYNLPVEEMNVTKLFNLLSLYGAVLRIKILRDKPDTALAQFSHPIFATLACYYLANAPLFGKDNAELQIRISKNTEVNLPRTDDSGTEAPEEVAKRTVAFQPQDQRARLDEIEKFLRSGCKPTNTLFIANVNESVDEAALKELLSTIGTVTKVELGPAKQPSKRLTAMVEMASERLALTAVCHLHNHQFCGLNIKVAFSRRILKDGNN